jgi:hypothetical protein
MKSVIVEYDQCNKLALFLKDCDLPSDTEEPMTIELQEDVTKNFYFAIVAICHQTSPLNGSPLCGFINSKQYKGWDYLRNRWLLSTKKDNSLVYPEKLSRITEQELLEMLQDDRGRSNISDPRGRALLLNELGSYMLDNGYDSVQRLFNISEGYLNRRDRIGILQIMSDIRAYSDPVKKKSLFFLSLMRNHGLWQYKDEKYLGPPVDYHEVRGHLRYGSVRIKCRELYNKLNNRIEVTQAEDIEIRQAVYDAIMYISERTRSTASTLHYFFWNLFRNCCSRENPHCEVCPANCALPKRYLALRPITNHRGCLLSEGCSTAKSKIKLLEHEVNTEYY